MLQEDRHNEFKQSFSEDVIQTLVAFANAKGGTVHIGRCDDGTPCGVTLGKETIQKWINEIKQKTEPSIIPDVDIENIENKQVVTLHVQEVLPDRIEFYNPGTLPDDISIEDLKTNNYSSRPRNKQVADVFKDMGEIEKYGSGIRRVVRMFTEAGHPSPEWKQISGGIMVTAWNASVFGNNEEKFGNNERDFGNNEEKFGNNENLKSEIQQLNLGQKKTLYYILNHEGSSISEIANHLNMPNRTIYHHIKKLIIKGLIERVGSRKSGGYRIKQ